MSRASCGRAFVRWVPTGCDPSLVLYFPPFIQPSFSGRLGTSMISLTIFDQSNVIVKFDRLSGQSRGPSPHVGPPPL
jgi:hypothetical protein